MNRRGISDKKIGVKSALPSLTAFLELAPIKKALCLKSFNGERVSSYCYIFNLVQISQIL